jgi:hypothetical protein
LLCGVHSSDGFGRIELTGGNKQNHCGKQEKERKFHRFCGFEVDEKYKKFLQKITDRDFCS